MATPCTACIRWGRHAWPASDEADVFGPRRTAEIGPICASAIIDACGRDLSMSLDKCLDILAGMHARGVALNIRTYNAGASYVAGPGKRCVGGTLTQVAPLLCMAAVHGCYVWLHTLLPCLCGFVLLLCPR